MASKLSIDLLRTSSAEEPQLPPDLYQAIFRHSNEPIAIVDLNGFYLQQNAAHEQLLGYTDEELMGQTAAIHMGQEAFEEVFNAIVEHHEYRGEIVSKTKSGETKHIELSAFTMRDADRRPICFVGIARDASERKQAEAALERSEAQLTDFFENAAVPMHWVGPDGVILRVNRAELEMLGYTLEEFEGRHIAEFHVDQDVIEDILRRLAAGEVIHDREARLRCKDGSIKHVRINSSVYWEDGKFIHTRCFTRDITESKHSETRLALQYAVTQILSESTDLINSAWQILSTFCQSLGWEVGAFWQVDGDARMLRNVEMYHVTSVQTPEFDGQTQTILLEKGQCLPGRIWASGKPEWCPDVVEEPNFLRAGAAAHEKLHAAFGFPIKLGNQVLGVVEFYSSEIREPDDELMKMIAGIGGQIGQFTVRKRAEQESLDLYTRERAARAEAEKANRLKDEFLATLSHELRTPLNAVIGWSRMLNSGRLTREDAQHALEVIERNAWAQKQIIEDILDVSRVITGKLQLNVGPVDVVTVVDAALDAVRPAMEAKEIKIETVIDASLKMVSGDADRLQQVIWNVLSNAAKFTPAGGEVEIVVSQTPTHVQVLVKDSGPGIDPDFLPHVFERFRQADGTTTRTHGGLGLGLAIVRHLVELHGGTIGVENRTDHTGAVFTISLPLPSGELRLETLANASLIFKEAPHEAPTLEGLKVLLVDDEPDTLDLINVELAQHGAQVTGVTRAAEALALLEKNHFDVLISDIGMPGMDGYELIGQLRKKEAGQDVRLPAVALTAYARVQDRMRAILAGYSTHIAKPVEANELLTVVASLAGRLGKS